MFCCCFLTDMAFVLFYVMFYVIIRGTLPAPQHSTQSLCCFSLPLSPYCLFLFSRAEGQSFGFGSFSTLSGSVALIHIHLCTDGAFFPTCLKGKSFLFCNILRLFCKFSWFSSIPPSSSSFMFHMSLLESILTVIYIRMSTLPSCVSDSCSLFPPSLSLSISLSLFLYYSPSFPPNPTHSRQPPIQTLKYDWGSCLIKGSFFSSSHYYQMFAHLEKSQLLISYKLINTTILTYSTNTCFV